MKTEKKILSIETSGELCSVALSFSENIFDERNILMKHIHSEKLIPMINELFSSNRISGKDLDAVAISVGPGSFTGLRIGMTAAKGIAFASNLPLIPIPTFNALALEICGSIQDNLLFAIINNANIDECYYAKYKSEKGLPVIIEDVKLLEKKEIDDGIENCDLVFGNVKAIKGIKEISSPRASSIGKWTYLFGEDLLTFEYDYLEPNYLKQFKVRKK